MSGFFLKHLPLKRTFVSSSLFVLLNKHGKGLKHADVYKHNKGEQELTKTLKNEELYQVFSVSRPLR